MAEATRLTPNHTATLGGREATGENEEAQETTDGSKQTFEIFTKFVLLRCLGLALYLFDMLTDINAAYGDYSAGDYLFAYITVGLIFAPGLLYSFYMACEYCYMYMGDIACLKGPLAIFTSPLLPLWVILRDVKHIIEGIIATICPKKRPALIEKSLQPNRIYLLKFLEAYIEAAPQLLVRLFRLATRNPQPFSDLRSSEILQISFSVVVLSLKVVSAHQQNVTTQQVLQGDSELHSKYRLPWFIQIIAIIWWICFLVSRFEALALFTASYHYWVFLVIGIHVVLMFGFQTIGPHKDRLKRVFIYIFGAFVFVFAYVQFNLKSRFKIAVWFPYAVFTIILFVENSVMLTFWFYSQQSRISTILETLNATKYLNYTSTIVGEYNYTSTIVGEYNLTSNFTADLIEDLGENVEERMVDKSDLLNHWTNLLFVHYGIFGIGLFFMIVTFCFTSCINNEIVDEDKKNRKEHHEMNVLSNSNQS